jgi:hypothetical protein
MRRKERKLKGGKMEGRIKAIKYKKSLWFENKISLQVHVLNT